MRKRRVTQTNQNVEWQTPKASQRFEINGWGDDNIYIQRNVFTNNIKKNKFQFNNSSRAIQFDSFRRTAFLPSNNNRSYNESQFSNIEKLKKQANMLDEDCMIRISGLRTINGARSQQNRPRILYKKEINKNQLQKNRKKEIKSIYIDCLCSEKQSKKKALKIFMGSQTVKQKRQHSIDQNFNFIIHQTNTKTPFKKLFQRKKQQKIKKTIQSSINKISGTKLQNALFQVNENITQL